MTRFTTTVPVGRARRWTFRAVAMLLPIALLVFGEVVARLSHVGKSDPYLSVAQTFAVFAKVQVGGEEYYQVVHPTAYTDRNVRFPVKKPRNALRIFCIGESANAGWPQPANQAWSEFLRQALAQAYPERQIEVLNISGHAQPSYRLRWMFDDVVDMDADAIIIWIGNNEFLEERSYLDQEFLNRASQWLMVHSQLFNAVRASISRLAPLKNVLGARLDVMPDAASKLFRVPKALKTDRRQCAKVIEHYRYNLEHMADETEKRSIPAVFLTVPVNLRDWLPNVSIHSVSGTRLDEWQEAYWQGRRLLDDGNPAAAIVPLESACNIDPDHAESRFHFARALDGAGRRHDASIQYRSARDLDANPVRAIGAFNEVVRSLPAKFANVRVFDADSALEEAASGEAPGYDLFLDYVHPNRAGNLVIARGVYELLVRGVFPAPSVRSDFAIDALNPANAYEPLRDYKIFPVLVALTLEMHQDEAAERYWAAWLTLAPPDAKGGALTAEHLELLRKFRQAERREAIGQPEAGDQEVMKRWNTVMAEIYGWKRARMSAAR